MGIDKIIEKMDSQSSCLPIYCSSCWKSLLFNCPNKQSDSDPILLGFL